MQLTYDPRYNIAYLQIQEKGPQVETIKVGEFLQVDLAPDGTVYGIELLNANDQLKMDQAGQFEILNLADGHSTSVPL